MLEKIYTQREAADFLGCSLSNVRQNSTLQGFRVGNGFGTKLFHVEELKSYKKQRDAGVVTRYFEAWEETPTASKDIARVIDSAEVAQRAGIQRGNIGNYPELRGLAVKKGRALLWEDNERLKNRIETLRSRLAAAK